MPFDANGQALVAGNRPVNGQDTDAAQINVPFADIQSMLSQTLLKSGVAPMTGNLNMNSFKVTNIAEGVNPSDVVAKSQLDAAISDISVTANKTVTVGSSGDFVTLNEALFSVSKIFGVLYAAAGIKVEIKLLSGFVMSEQIFVRGLDFSWVTITSEDAVVSVNPTGITQNLNSDMGQPLFGAVDGGRLPAIGVQFEYQTQQTGTSKVGVALFGGSSVQFLPGSGVRRASRGLLVFNNSEAYCAIPGYTSVDATLPGVYSVDFSSSYDRGLDVQHGSRAVLPRSKFNDCGQGAVSVYGIWGSFLDLTQSQVKNSKSTGLTDGAVRIRDSSYLCFREGDVSGSLSHGINASHAAIVDFRQKSGGGVTGSLGARNCAFSAVFADGSCKIEATELIATGCCTGSGWTSGAITANGCSTIMADLVDVSNSAAQGFHARNGSTISASGGVANTCTLSAVYAKSNGQVNFENGSATGCLDIALYADQSGVIEATSATATGAVVEGVRARRGSRVSVRSANMRKVAGDSSNDIVCSQGSIIDATESIGGVSKTVNVVDGNGIIFR